MRRRKLLAALTASVPAAGCMGLFDDREKSTLTPAGVPTSSETATPHRGPAVTASLADPETVPRTLALHVRQSSVADIAVDAEFVSPGTGDEPPVVEVTFTNTGSDQRSFRFDSTPPLTRHRGESSGDPALLLAPTPDHQWAMGIDYEPERAGSCWQAGQTPPIPAIVHFVKLPPNQSVRGEYHLLDVPANTACFPTGRYAFTASHGASLVLVAWDRTAPGPSTQSTLADRTVPGIPGGSVESTQWYHQAGSDTRVYVQPDTETVDLPETVTFRLVNRSREPLANVRPAWQLYKLHETMWKPVAPRRGSQSAAVLVPGATHEWPVRLAADTPDPEGSLAVGHVGGGTYAFRAGEPTGTVYATLLSIEASTATLSPSDHVSNVEQTGDTISVTTSREGPITDGQAVVVVRRVTDDADGPTLLVEQVMQNPALRNTLSFVEPGVREVRLRTSRSVARAMADYGYETRRFRFRNSTFRTTIES